MGRQSNRGVLIALAILIVVAAVIRVFGGPLWDALLSLHGPGGGGGH